MVVYESTVYGLRSTASRPRSPFGAKFNEDFFAGYSPERINPGGGPAASIKKITSGRRRDRGLCRRSVRQHHHRRATSLKVAEAAKVSNTQRDINIALINELARIFSKLGIDTEDVLKGPGPSGISASSPARRRACIGLDPITTYKAGKSGIGPK